MRALLAQCRIALADQATLGFAGLPVFAPRPLPTALHPHDAGLLDRLAHKPAPQASVSAAAWPTSLAQVRAELGDCTRCRLHQTRTHLVFGFGDRHAKLVFVGEGPGRDEDLQGQPFVGEAGRLLDRMLAAMGTAREQVYIANVIKCRPPKNRTPQDDEVEQCLPFLRRQLGAIGPSIVVSLGATASRALLGRPVKISKERGTWLSLPPWAPNGAPVALMPTFHPAYLLRNPADKALVWTDLQAVMRRAGLGGPRRHDAADAHASRPAHALPDGQG